MRPVLVTVICLAAGFASADPLPRRGTLGLPLRAVPEEIRTKLKLRPQDALQVTADANGLKSNELIVAVDGKRFKTFGEYNNLLRKFTDKDKAKLTILRDGKEVAVEIAVLPKPADNTDSYETIYDHVVSNGHRIRVFITKPKSQGKHPVFFWMQGINATTIDFPLSTKNAIAPLIKEFAESGYVTIRVEKPGVGDSEGGPANLVGYNEELDIYRQTLKVLDRYDYMDRQNVYVFGHSMGGCHAPLVCSEIPVKGIISYGTVSNSWLEWEVRAPRIQGPLGGQSLAEVDQDVRLVTAFYHFLFNERRTVAWIKKNRPELKATCDAQSPDGLMLGDRTVKYMQEVNDKNFAAAWAKLGATRVLALFGENDWISLKEDQAQVADIVNRANPGKAEFVIVPGSDHGFAKCTSMQDSFSRFGRTGNEFNPEIVKIIKDWIARS